jgi:parallel beta-helix repeat protein
MMSENTVVQRNVINYVIGDGFRILHNNSLVEFNLVQNSMNVDDGKDHRDGLQMFTNGNQFNLVNVTIRNNRFFSGVDHNRPFAASFQGICKYTYLFLSKLIIRLKASFDVLLFNVTVENNLVLIEADYHGIALYKSKDCVIMSNTVHNPTGATNAWITTVRRRKLESYN